MHAHHSLAEVRVARTRDELEQAYALVYKEYLGKGYANPDPSGLRFSLYNALPETTTFIGFCTDGRVAATATIVPDSLLGLPIDSIYEVETQRLRKTGARVCEVTMLAVDLKYLSDHDDSLGMGKRIHMFSLFRRLLDYANNAMKCDYMCIAIHPKHNRFFKELLFRNFGLVKLYPEVNLAPAVGKYVNMHRVKEGFSKPGKEKLYDIFVRTPVDPGAFTGKIQLTPQDLRYFFEEKSRIFETFPQSNVRYVLSCYEERRASV